MSTPAKDLAARIAELRRRHFGARGKTEFAQRLGIALDEYQSYERGALPPGELMVRMCELTGEDLQWLLTGVAARGTVVISGTRSRHQDLLTRLAAALDQNPALASPVEAFLDLLLSERSARAAALPTLPAADPHHLIPVYAPEDAPPRLPTREEAEHIGSELARRISTQPDLARQPAALAEPAMAYADDDWRPVSTLRAADDGGRAPLLVSSADLARMFRGAFGVRVADDAMAPMFKPGDAALVALDAAPQIGRPAVIRLTDEPAARCRLWLGTTGDNVRLGRVRDGVSETIARDAIAWSLEALYCLSAAA